MASSGDIIQMTVKGYYATPATTIINVFQYEILTTPDINFGSQGQAFIDAWREWIEPTLAPILSQEVQFNDVTILNLTDPLEIYVGSFTDPIQGATVGDVCPPFVTWSFMLRRTNTSTRNGQKRYAGVPETYQTSGVPTVGASVALNAHAAVIGAPYLLEWTDPVEAEAILNPVIVRKNAAGAMTASQPVLNAVFRSIGSQNTRKLGRGS